MIQRLKTAIVLVLIVAMFFVARFWQPFCFDFLILTISLMGTYEVSNGFFLNKKFNYMLLEFAYCLANYLVFTIGIALKIKFSFLLLMIVSVFIGFSIIALILPIIKTQQNLKEYNQLKKYISYESYSTQKSFTTILVFLYPVFLLNGLYFLNNIGLINFAGIKLNADFGLFSLFLLFAISVLTDTMAYFVGKALKGPKLAPKISPNKTISGSIGGLIGGIIGAIVVFVIFNAISEYKLLFGTINLSLYHIVMIGLLGSIATQAGDLLESHIKRKLKLKDFGNIFPGHGGVMDRIDGLSINAMLITLVFIFAFI